MDLCNAALDACNMIIYFNDICYLGNLGQGNHKHVTSPDPSINTAWLKKRNYVLSIKYTYSKPNITYVEPRLWQNKIESLNNRFASNKVSH